MADEPSSLSEILYERFDEQVQTLDKALQKASDEGCLDDFVESYLNLRDSGLSFQDAIITAAEERDINLEDEEKSDDEEEDEE